MFKEISALTSLSLRGIPDRPLSALVTITGVATMVAVMTALLALGAGLMSSATRNIGPDKAVVVAVGAASDYMGSISRDAVSAVGEAPGVKKDGHGRPIVTPSIALAVEVMRKDNRQNGRIDLIGVPADRFGGFDGTRVIKGRLFRPGLRELVAGRVAGDRYEHLRVGDRIALRGSQWTVVGEFEAGGSIAEGSLYGDADTIMSAFDRNAFQQIEVQLASPGDFPRFKAAVEEDPRFSVEARLQREFVRDRMSQLTSVINFVGYFVGTVMALGAFFGILNTMYAAIDSRRRELATLRALGFGRVGILTSITLESLVLAFPGALIGVAIAWLMFDGHLGQVSGLAFPIAVTPGIAITGIVWTLAIGLIGGLVPSVMAVRLPIATALRAT